MRGLSAYAPQVTSPEQVQAAQSLQGVAAGLAGREAKRARLEDAVAAQLALRKHDTAFGEKPSRGSCVCQVHAHAARAVLQPETALLQLAQRAQHEAGLAGGAQQRLQGRDFAVA